MSEMIPYVVRTGDHLPLIAMRTGVDADTIWNDPKNAELKKLRGSPNILCVGDILYIPAPPPKNWLPLNVGASNKFTAAVPAITLSVTFTQGGKALANVECVVRDLPSAGKLTTDGSGKLVVKVPLTMQVVVIEVPSLHLVRTLKLGHLDPVTETTGVIQRLQNLGYTSPRTSVNPSDDDHLACLVAAFQADNGLPATGNVDTDTANMLQKVHGC
jgi:hypothetical protein